MKSGIWNYREKCISDRFLLQNASKSYIFSPILLPKSYFPSKIRIPDSQTVTLICVQTKSRNLHDRPVTRVRNLPWGPGHHRSPRMSCRIIRMPTKIAAGITTDDHVVDFNGAQLQLSCRSGTVSKTQARKSLMMLNMALGFETPVTIVSRCKWFDSPKSDFKRGVTQGTRRSRRTPGSPRSSASASRPSSISMTRVYSLCVPRVLDRSMLESPVPNPILLPCVVSKKHME